MTSIDTTTESCKIDQQQTMGDISTPSEVSSSSVNIRSRPQLTRSSSTYIRISSNNNANTASDIYCKVPVPTTPNDLSEGLTQSTIPDESYLALSRPVLSRSDTVFMKCADDTGPPPLSADTNPAIQSFQDIVDKNMPPISMYTGSVCPGWSDYAPHLMHTNSVCPGWEENAPPTMDPPPIDSHHPIWSNYAPQLTSTSKSEQEWSRISGDVSTANTLDITRKKTLKVE